MVRGLFVEAFEIRLRDEVGQELVWVMCDPLRFVRNPEDALQAAQVFMDTLRSDARALGIPVDSGFKNVKKVGKTW